MKKEEIYSQLPRLIIRLGKFGVPAAVAFLVFWYFGGHNLWGRFLDLCMSITAFYYPVSFAPGSSEIAAFERVVEAGGQKSTLTFPVNRLNTSMVEVVTLLGLWPSKSWRAFFKLAAWCLLFTVLYQTFNVVIQLYVTEIGPDLANRFQLFWKETTWYRVIEKISDFDMFILRYWAGFPIFLCALVCAHLTSPQKPEPKK
jgi:hypothetical protein